MDLLLTLMAFGLALFVVLHRCVSATALRAMLTGRFGEDTYRRSFAAASLLALTLLSLGYRQARGHGPGGNGWLSGGPEGAAVLIVLAFGLFLIVAGLTTRNPATAGLEETVSEPDIVRGALRITRHPFLWGISLVSICHLIVRPVAANLVFFGGLAFLALTGTASIDAKRTRAFGDAYGRFVERTSNVPFAAVLQGRQTISAREIGWIRVTAALIALAAILAAHECLL